LASLREKDSLIKQKFLNRDAERQAAIDSCEKLDMLGLLRASQDEACTHLCISIVTFTS
jgi:hypothetical protein